MADRPLKPQPRCRQSGGVRALWLFLIFLLLPARLAFADPAKGDVTVNTAGGYARIVLSFTEDIDAQVQVAGTVMVIKFTAPVEFSLDKLTSGAAGYISAARRDPDGMGVRLALARKLSANSMSAGEKIFIDLLPDTWKGQPPGLPQEVVQDLARRAREAERRARQQRQSTQPPEITSRVRVARQPTFTRYVFELPEFITVTPDRGDDRLSLTFEARVKFDLADAKADLPPALNFIDAKTADQNTKVEFGLIGAVDLRTFREDNNYVVDVGVMKEAKAELIEAPKPVVEPASAKATPKVEPPDTVPARVAVAPSVTPKPPDPKPAEKPAQTPAAARSEQAEPQAPRMPAEAKDAAPVRAESIAADVKRVNDSLRIDFPFATPVPAASFRRADTLWLVFDSLAPIDVSALASQAVPGVRAATLDRQDDFQIVRLKLERPRLATMALDGTNWIVSIGEGVTEQSQPVAITRNVIGTTKPSAVVPFEAPSKVHRVVDPDIGDTLLVVTALGPPRGLPRTQDFVEFRAVASLHGVVVQPVADDIDIELADDKIVISRPRGLSLSAANGGARRGGTFRPVVFEPQTWGFDRQSPFTERLTNLINAAATAADVSKRGAARFDLARFYFARDLHAEAKGVLDVALADDRPTMEDPSGLIMRGAANVMMGRSDDALRDLSSPFTVSQPDALIWRALALAEAGKWSDARQGLANTDAAMKALPIELQRFALKMTIKVAIEAKDFSTATDLLGEFDVVGAPRDMEPYLSVITGQIAEGLGRNSDALASYHAAAESYDRASASQGRLYEVGLRYRSGNMTRDEAIAALETLTAIWRGDETEVEALYLLAKLYIDEGRFRDAFNLANTALTTHPTSEVTRRLHEEASQTFDQLYLGGKADSLPPIDALSIFYDFREFAPIDRRGDEMIRRLAERLVAVDLLDQAAELLQHQVDHRLQGAARAQVATKLAMIYLTNRKPDRALAILRATRTAELSNELRNQRLLLEARCLSDIGRQGLALEVAANIPGREAIRLRSDILWTARRYGESAEQIELMYADRGKEWQALNDVERTDMLRAGLGYVLANDKIGFARFREKFSDLINQGRARSTFDVLATSPAADSQELRDLAKTIAATDTLDMFLRELRGRYPETGGVPLPDRLSNEVMPQNALAKGKSAAALR